MNERTDPTRLPDSSSPPEATSASRLMNPEPVSAPNEAPSESSTPDLAEQLAAVESERNLLKERLGRQGNEIGELRSTVEQLSQSIPKPEAPDFFDDPEAAIERQVEAKLQERDALSHAREVEVTRAKLDAQHPGWESLVKENDFQSWVAEDPARVELFRTSNTWESANSLLKTWHEIAAAGEAGESRAAVAKAARTEPGTPRPPRGKRYSRAKIRQLAQTNRAAYDAELPEIRRAYEEGRVTE